MAAVGPHIVNPDGSTYPSARTAPGTGVAVGHALLGRIAPHNRFTRAYRQSDAPADDARDVDWVSGAALWFRRSALDRVGGWDERYFMFLEDVDVCRELIASGVGRSLITFATIACTVGPLNGGSPASISYVTAPSA